MEQVITMQTFIELLFIFSVITGLIVQCIKKMIEDKEHKAYNIIAFVVAIIVGTIGTFIYYSFNDIPITVNNVIFAVLLGGASGLASELGFDKIKQAAVQIGFKG